MIKTTTWIEIHPWTNEKSKVLDAPGKFKHRERFASLLSPIKEKVSQFGTADDVFFYQQ